MISLCAKRYIKTTVFREASWRNGHDVHKRKWCRKNTCQEKKIRDRESYRVKRTGEIPFVHVPGQKGTEDRRGKGFEYTNTVGKRDWTLDLSTTARPCFPSGQDCPFKGSTATRGTTHELRTQWPHCQTQGELLAQWKAYWTTNWQI